MRYRRYAARPPGVGMLRNVERWYKRSVSAPSDVGVMRSIEGWTRLGWHAYAGRYVGDVAWLSGPTSVNTNMHGVVLYRAPTADQIDLWHRTRADIELYLRSCK